MITPNPHPVAAVMDRVHSCGCSNLPELCGPCSRDVALVKMARDLRDALSNLVDIIDPSCDGSGCKKDYKHTSDCSLGIYEEAISTLRRWGK